MEIKNSKRYKVWDVMCCNDDDNKFDYFRLIQQEGDAITLVCCDKHGNTLEGSNILVIDENIDSLVILDNVNDNTCPLLTNYKGEVSVTTRFDLAHFINEMHTQSLMKKVFQKLTEAEREGAVLN